MKTTIYCKTTDKGLQSFYLKRGAQEYFLFTSNFRRSNKNFFGGGVYIDDALAAKNNTSTSVSKIAEKLFGAIRYIESEYEIAVLDKTVNKNSKTRKGYKRSRVTAESYAEAV